MNKPPSLEIIHYPAKSPSGHPPIIFVHGAFHAAWCWEKHFLPWFSERGWESYALSLRGHGQSEGKENIAHWTLNDYETDIWQVVEQLRRPCILVGHSMGAILVQRCFAKSPDVLAMAFLACSPLKPALSVTVKILFRHPGLAFKMLTSKNLVHLKNLSAKLFFSPDLNPSEKETYLDLLDLESPIALREIFSRSAHEWDPDEKRPVFFIAGDKDWSIPLNATREMAKQYQAELKVCPGYHDLMLDPYWEKSAQALLDWLLLHFDKRPPNGQNTA